MKWERSKLMAQRTKICRRLKRSSACSLKHRVPEPSFIPKIRPPGICFQPSYFRNTTNSVVARFSYLVPPYFLPSRRCGYQSRILPLVLPLIFLCNRQFFVFLVTPFNSFLPVSTILFCALPFISRELIARIVALLPSRPTRTYLRSA